MILKEVLRIMLSEKAVSKKQQRFFGMVRAAQKGEGAASPEVAKVASDISKKDAKDFAKTKHKGLPEKKKMKENVTLQDANGNDFIEDIDLIKPEPLKKQESLEESIGYKEFTRKSREAMDKLRKQKQERNKKNADAAYKDKVTKGVKFYDNKGSGYIKKGKKKYD